MSTTSSQLLIHTLKRTIKRQPTYEQASRLLGKRGSTIQVSDKIYPSDGIPTGSLFNEWIRINGRPACPAYAYYHFEQSFLKMQEIQKSSLVNQQSVEVMEKNK